MAHLTGVSLAHCNSIRMRFTMAGRSTPTSSHRFCTSADTTDWSGIVRPPRGAPGFPAVSDSGVLVTDSPYSRQTRAWESDSAMVLPARGIRTVCRALRATATALPDTRPSSVTARGVAVGVAVAFHPPHVLFHIGGEPGVDEGGAGLRIRVLPGLGTARSLQDEHHHEHNRQSPCLEPGKLGTFAVVLEVGDGSTAGCTAIIVVLDDGSCRRSTTIYINSVGGPSKIYAR